MPHKAKNLMDKILDDENIKLSYYQSGKGKWERDDFRWYSYNYLFNLEELKQSIIDKSYRVGNYTCFVVHEPKERLIMKLPVKDRVAQHMWDNIISPIFDKKFYYHLASIHKMGAGFFFEDNAEPQCGVQAHC